MKALIDDIRFSLGALASQPLFTFTVILTLAVVLAFNVTLFGVVKGVLLEVAVLYRDHVAGLAMDLAEESRQAYVADGGTIVEMSPEARAAWASAMPNIAQEWAAELNAKGEPGTEMLNAYLAKLAAAGFSPVRDWTAVTN